MRPPPPEMAATMHSGAAYWSVNAICADAPARAALAKSVKRQACFSGIHKMLSGFTSATALDVVSIMQSVGLGATGSYGVPQALPGRLAYGALLTS